jgi:hypothetical protein
LITFVSWDLNNVTKGSDWDSKKGTEIMTGETGEASFGLEFPANGVGAATAVLRYRAANGKTAEYTISNWP